MTLYAILSDIHANYLALKAVEADAERVKNDLNEKLLMYICLGDVVDYGPHPNKCMDWVVEKQEKGLLEIVRGNHDEDTSEYPDIVYVKNGEVHVDAPSSIDSLYWPITLWTRQTLTDAHKSTMHKWKKESLTLRDFTLFHDTLTSNHGKIETIHAAAANFEHLKTKYGFFGHTHYQGLFSSLNEKCEGYFAVPAEFTPLEQIYDDFIPHKNKEAWRPISVLENKEIGKNDLGNLGVAEEAKMLINPGSVGQPRPQHVLDQDNPKDIRAAYMLMHINGSAVPRFAFRRIEYEIQKYREALRSIRWQDDKSTQVYHDFLKEKYEETLTKEHSERDKKYYQTIVSCFKGASIYYTDVEPVNKYVANLNEVTQHLVTEYLIKNFTE
jgi:predicted phosphodiesterase